ncbi:MAG: hypothetical protein AAFW83_08450 [Pseudomonadota bacterium]
MSEVKETPTVEEFLRPSKDTETIDPAHRAWMDDEIRKTLAKKARGEMKYTPADDVRKEFGV